MSTTNGSVNVHIYQFNHAILYAFLFSRPKAVKENTQHSNIRMN